MTAKEILVGAREILREPASWVKGDLALGAKGEVTSPTDRRACRFCMLGAVTRAAWPPDEATNAGERMLAQVEAERVLNHWSYGSAQEFNDDPRTKHRDVMIVLDRAIAAA